MEDTKRKVNNLMIVNGEEVVYTDAQMADFYLGFLEGHSKAYYNLSKRFRELNNEKKVLEKEKENLLSRNENLAVLCANYQTNYETYKRWYDTINKILPEIIGKTRAETLKNEVETYEEK